MNDKIIKRFMNDTSLSQTIYDFLLDQFLQDQSKDVNYLAASRLSIDLLRKAWIRMEEMRKEDGHKDSQARQVGL